MTKSDRWIKKMAIEEEMIPPFSEKQIGEGVISYGLSSYGYDIRLKDEFKIPDLSRKVRCKRRDCSDSIHRIR